MKPIVLAILGGLSILLFFSRTGTNHKIKTVSANQIQKVRAVIRPVQQVGLHDLLFGRFGL